MSTIAFFNSVKGWGGGEKWHYEVALHFAKQGYPVYFFTEKDSILFEKLRFHPEITVKEIKMSNISFLNFGKTNKLKNLFISLKINILVINLPKDLKLAAHAACRAGIKKVIYRRGSAIPIYNSILNRYIFKYWVTGILANSQATKQSILLQNPYLFEAGKIKVINNPIDIESFLQTPFSPVYHRKGREIILGNIGRLEPQKNQEFLIKLSVALKEKEIAHTILIGGTGRLEQDLKEKCNLAGVSGNIVFTGFLPNVKDLLMACDIFILPSLWEGFGYVLAEAALCRKPVIAFNISSNPEIIKDAKTGFLIAENDVAGCLDKIELLHNDDGLCQTMGEAGFAFVSATFNKEAINKQIEAYFTCENDY